jgi:hypothetical protein
MRIPEGYEMSLEIEQFVRGSTLRGPSSIDLGWNGFAIERHSLPELWAAVGALQVFLLHRRSVPKNLERVSQMARDVSK